MHGWRRTSRASRSREGNTMKNHVAPIERELQRYKKLAEDAMSQIDEAALNHDPAGGDVRGAGALSRDGARGVSRGTDCVHRQGCARRRVDVPVYSTWKVRRVQPSSRHGDEGR